MEGQQLVRILDRTLSDTARDFGMNKTELGVLMFLYENPDKDTAKNIVECRMLTKSCVSKAIDSLVKQEYLKVQEDQKDRRILHLIVQEKAAESVQAGEEAQRQILCGITEEEKQTFLQVCRKIQDNCTLEYRKVQHE